MAIRFDVRCEGADCLAVNYLFTSKQHRRSATHRPKAFDVSTNWELHEASSVLCVLILLCISAFCCSMASCHTNVLLCLCAREHPVISGVASDSFVGLFLSFQLPYS